jgi:SagB-type dehydrogenase family enzyme
MSLPFEDQEDNSDKAVAGSALEEGAAVETADFATLAGRAQGFLNEGRFDAAREVFVEILGVLAPEPSYQRAVALERVGFCSLMEGQPLVAADYLQQATEMVEDIPPTDAVKALQGVIQSELGQVFSLTGYVEQAREAYEAAIEIARSVDDQRALGIDLDHLGVLNLRQGNVAEAHAQFAEALSIFKSLQQPGAQAVALHHLGISAEHAKEYDDAEQHYTDAARLLVDHQDYVSAGRLFVLAATACTKAGRNEAAEGWFRNALEHSRLGHDPAGLRRTLSSFARLLQLKPDGLAEARELIEEALEASENSLEADVWALYGQLADVIELQAAAVGSSSDAAALRMAAGNYRHVGDYGPRLLETLKDIGEEPSFGAAVILERVGRCCLIGGRPAPAVILFRQALAALDAVPETEVGQTLRGLLQSAMGDAYRLAGFPADAKKAYDAALSAAAKNGDLRAELVQHTHLGAFALASGEAGAGRKHLLAGANLARKLGEKDVLGGLERQLEGLSANSRPDASNESEADDTADEPRNRSRVQEDIVTECAFGSDLLIELNRATRMVPLGELVSAELSGEARPMLAPCVRTAVDEAGDLRFYIPSGEPELVQEQDCIVMRKRYREVVVAEHIDATWTVIRLADGKRSVRSILEGVPTQDRDDTERLLAHLVELGAYDISGRAVARFMHSATKKGVLIGGGLQSEGVLKLVTDGDYRSYPAATRIELSDDVPDAIGEFHALTRSRRSRRDYASTELSRIQFDALLHTACGTTGGAAWSDLEVKLRSYPSSGALYAVEIYPVVFGVEGLEPGIYHYVAADNALEAVKLDVEFSDFINACLPVEREMVSSAGAMICLVGEFRRHERKYGEGGYRMMIAEAGHISQNLVLSATALGMSARPFGGVFDTLINRNLGLDENEEQFLLSVLIGNVAGGAAMPDRER